MTYTHYDQLPLILSVGELTKILGIGKIQRMTLYAAAESEVSVSDIKSESRKILFWNFSKNSHKPI